MGQEKKRKTLVYKRAHFHQAGPKLSIILAAALKASGTIGERRECLAPDGETPIWRLIGDHKANGNFVFGVLMRYMPGMHPPCLIDDASAKTVTVQQLAVPKTAEGMAREMVEDMLFFACMDNHMVLMQSSGLRAKQLETHLQWLLHKTEALVGTNTLQLIDQPTKNAAAALEEHEVRELDIGGDLVPSDEAFEQGAASSPAVAQSSGVGGMKHVVSHDGGASAGVWATLKSLLSIDQAAQIDTDALTGSNIGYTLSIRYNRSTTDDGHKLMNTLGSALRHAEGVKTTLHLVDGSTISGDELRLSGPVRITHYDGVPSSVEVFEEMRVWLLDKAKSGDLAG